MLVALLSDLAVIEGHQLVTTVDPRVMLAVPPGVEAVTLSPARNTTATYLDHLIASADAVWLIAPETGRLLERLAARVEKKGRILLGSGADAIRRASDKAGLPRLLARLGMLTRKTRRPHQLRALGDQPPVSSATRLSSNRLEARASEGVWLARNARELRHAVAMARQAGGRERLLLQRYVPGVAASVSLLADGRARRRAEREQPGGAGIAPALLPGRHDAARPPDGVLGGRGGASDVSRRSLACVATSAWTSCSRSRRPLSSR